LFVHNTALAEQENRSLVCASMDRSLVHKPAFIEQGNRYVIHNPALQ